MIILFTDFGRRGPYTGQMTAVLRRAAPQVDVIDLFADAPSRDPKAAAYVLAAYAPEFPPGVVFLCVVDPGVGGERVPAIVHADGRWFVGPENGLFELVLRRAVEPPRWWQITWRPEHLSASFHGRDLFAPVAAHLARSGVPMGEEQPVDAVRRADWPDDLREVVYVDGYGNIMTGVRAATVPAA
jgi:S-adenosylmethionine hydrolase